MSGSINLSLVTGTDWAIQMVWTDENGDPIVFTEPTMDVRQELSPTGTLIAQLDESGNLDGTITITDPGTLLLTIPKITTLTLQPGIAFWDIFMTVYGSRIQFAFGTVSIASHVTAVA